MNVEPVIAFLNRDGHDSFRYITLGFGSELAKVSTYTNAGSVDGDYNSARLLPEMTHYGSAQLTNAKFYGTAGMSALRAMLEHANRYGLKYIFVHDPITSRCSPSSDGERLKPSAAAKSLPGPRRTSLPPQDWLRRDARALAGAALGHIAHRPEFSRDFPGVLLARPAARRCRCTGSGSFRKSRTTYRGLVAA